LKQSVDEFVKNCSWIENFEKKLLLQVIEINKNDKYRKLMGGRGDTNYQTRWYWRCDISDYLRESYDEYKKIFGDEAVSVEDLRLYGLLFEGVMGLHRMSEMNSSTLPMLFSFDLQYFEYIHKLLGVCF
jgi:hypothetical protein